MITCMENERFERFSVLIGSIYKDLQRIKTSETQKMGLKSVHVMWLYLLKKHPQGLSASELAKRSNTDRSLVSREIGELIKTGMLTSPVIDGKRCYNRKIRLTDAGCKVAEHIEKISLQVQHFIDRGIEQADLENLYKTLNTLSKNLTCYAETVCCAATPGRKE